MDQSVCRWRAGNKAWEVTWHKINGSSSVIYMKDIACERHVTRCVLLSKQHFCASLIPPYKGSIYISCCILPFLPCFQCSCLSRALSRELPKEARGYHGQRGLQLLHPHAESGLAHLDMCCCSEKRTVQFYFSLLHFRSPPGSPENVVPCS